MYIICNYVLFHRKSENCNLVDGSIDLNLNLAYGNSTDICSPHNVVFRENPSAKLVKKCNY